MNVELTRFQIPKVRPASFDDVIGVTRTLAKAFEDYAFMRHVVSSKDYPVRLERFHRIFLERIGIPYGRVWVTEDLSAVSIWTTPEISQAGDIFSDLLPQFEELSGDRARQYVAAEQAMGAHRPNEPVWFLGSIAVDPSRQGQGLGTAVMEPGLRAAQEAGLPAFLETSDKGNVAFYQRLGFEITAQYELPMGGPCTWAMIRRVGPAVR